jgi:hypothetical protein
MEFAEVDNGSVIVCRVLQRGRGSIKVRKRLVEGKGY